MNLWAWRTDRKLHLGVSENTDLQSVCDITVAAPHIDSIAGLWAMFPSLSSVIAQCQEWLQIKALRCSVSSHDLVQPLNLDECWAAGVSYQVSRDARVEESRDNPDVYRRVYNAERPELFFKAPGNRVVGPNQTVGLRRDSAWQVPEPELTVIIGPDGNVFGYTAGNDMSSRDIEGENPLYLPQAKLFHHSAAIGPSIALAGTWDPSNAVITMSITRQSRTVFTGDVPIKRMRRTIPELMWYLRREWPLAEWTALMTGTGLVPPPTFTVLDGDMIHVTISGIGTLTNLAKRIDPSWVRVPDVP